MEPKNTPKAETGATIAHRTMAKVFVGVSLALAVLILGGLFWLLFRPISS